MRNKMKSPFIAFTCYLFFPFSSFRKPWCFRRLHICKEAVSKWIDKLRRRKTQRPVLAQSSQKTEEAADSKIKGSEEQRTLVYSHPSSGTPYPVLCNESSLPGSAAAFVLRQTDQQWPTHAWRTSGLLQCRPSVGQEPVERLRFLAEVILGCATLLGLEPAFCCFLALNKVLDILGWERSPRRTPAK